MKHPSAAAKRISAKSAAVVSVLLAMVLAGCGSNEPSGPTTTLQITRDFGAKSVAPEARVAATPGLTVMRQLEQTAAVETTFGGRFVNSIDDLKGGGGNDWLFFVDGIESDKAATEWRLSGGETVQWDYHAWQAVKTGGAIVGAFPRPLVNAGAKLECLPADTAACSKAKAALAAADIETGSTKPGAITLYVGEWPQLKGRPGVPDLSTPAADNGTFASVSPDGESLVVVDDQGQPSQRLRGSAGLVAASKTGTKVTWIVTGLDEAGLIEAVGMLNQGALENRFAVAAGAPGRIGLPTRSGATAATGPTGATDQP